MGDFQQIIPAAGNGLLETQFGVGSTPGFDAIDRRRNWGVGRQEGVLSPGAWKVEENSAGPNMQVEIAASVDGALIEGDTVQLQGLYYVAPHSQSILLDVPAADPTNPTMHLIVLRALDEAHDGGSTTQARVELLEGAPSANANHDNLLGAQTLPDSAMLLATVRVLAGVTTIGNGSIRDRRPWGVGAFTLGKRTAGNADSSSGVNVEVGTNDTRRRVELSGAPVLLGMAGRTENTGTGSLRSAFSLGVGGVPVVKEWLFAHVGANKPEDFTFETLWTPPAPGSYLLSAYYRVHDGGGITTVYATDDQPFMWWLRELPDCDVDGHNGTV